MKFLCLQLEKFFHGALVGGVLGLLAGGIEYCLLFLPHGGSGELAGAYWSIILPYASIGLCGGLAVTGGLRLLWGDPPTLEQHIARLCATLTALLAFSYLVVWATYQLGPPVFKLANFAAYVASALAASVCGILVWYVSRSLLLWLKGEGQRATYRVRVGTPLILSSLIVILLFLPTAYFEGAVGGTPPSLASPANTKRPNIIFILIDALRADHLHVYGYSRQTAPHLTALAQHGMLFTNMYAQGGSTRPSVATILSSLYPAVHKVNYERDFLSDSIVVLPELLRTAGYKTFGVSSNANVSPTFGYSQGFDEFWVWKTESPFRLTMLGRVAEDALGSRRVSQILQERTEAVPHAQVITDVTLEWVSRNSAEPLFLYVHYIDPHDPYSPPPPYNDAFNFKTDPPRRAGGVDPLALLPEGMDAAVIGKTLDQYDGEILYADSETDRLLGGLEKLGVLDDALVLVTADHGEEFFEHGQNSHRSAYEEILRVPFLAHWPHRIPAGTVYNGTVGLIDVMPTLLELLALEPPAGIQGRSFATQLMTPTVLLPARPLFAQVVQDGFALDVVRDGQYKLIQHRYGPRQGLEELYDLAQDPLERTNLASHAQTPLALVQKHLAAFNTVTSQAASQVQTEKVQQIDRDTQRALRSLGYIK